MSAILAPVLTLGGLGVFFGVLLAVSSKIFAVKQDERLAKIVEVLPNANCGGCGFAGCAALAGAVIEGKAPINGCPVGGAAVAAKVAEIMGVEASPSVRYVAHVNCRGGDGAKRKYDYDGIIDCLAASKVAGGPLSCQFGCMGMGTCVKACDYDAMHIVDGAAFVDTDNCVACGKCISACPRGLISLVSDKQKVFVSCASKAKGGEVRLICNVGCIGCMLCEKKCPTGAIKVENNLAHIDGDKCIGCGECVAACPRKLIVNLAADAAPAAPETDAPASQQ